MADGYIERFDPHRDAKGRVVESEVDYARRMRATVLSEWPIEVLIEWFHRHAGYIGRYAFLRYETFKFERRRFALTEVPGREAFRDERFCDDFADVEARIRANRTDGLAQYMLREGTWNTPIVLLCTAADPVQCPPGEVLKRPWHLLEGHRRLSFLVGLREQGRAASVHEVWCVHREGEAVGTDPGSDRHG
ncbi:MAG: hypothetical protein ACOC9P_01500 [bacterium]